MASEAQILANRENAQKSCGPKTPQGLAISSRNAVKTSLFARNPVMGPEQQEEFDRLVSLLVDTFEPASWIEEDLIHELADSKWRLLRARTEERSLYQNDYQANMEDGVEWNYGEAYQRMGKPLDRIRGYQRRFERRYDKLWSQLTQMVNQRRNAEIARQEAEARAKRNVEIAAAMEREHELETQLDELDEEGFRDFVANSSADLGLPMPSAADIRAELAKVQADIEARLTNRK